MSSSHAAHQQLGWTHIDQPSTPLPGAPRSRFGVGYASRTSLRASPFSGSESNESAYSPNPTVHPALESTPLTGSPASTAPSTTFNTPVASPVASPVLGPDKPVHLPGSIPVAPPFSPPSQPPASPVAAPPQIDDDPVFLRALEEDMVAFWADRVEVLESEVQLRQLVIASYQRDIAQLAEHAGKAERSLRADLLVHLQNQQEARERLAQARENLEALRAKEQVQLAPVAEKTAMPAGPVEEANSGPALDDDEPMSAIQSIAQLAKSLLDDPRPMAFTPASPQTPVVSAPAPTPAPSPAAVSGSTTASIPAPVLDPVATPAPDHQAPAPPIQPTPTKAQRTQRATIGSDNGKPKLVKKPKLLHELKWLVQVGGAGNSVAVGKRKRSDDDEEDGGSDKRSRTRKMTAVSKEKSVTDEWDGRLRKRRKGTRESWKREEAAANLNVVKPMVGEKKRKVGRPRKEERK